MKSLSFRGSSLAATGLVALLSSCADPTVRNDVKDSYGVLYPVKLAGDGIEVLGKSVAAVSSPKKWISPREKKFEQETTPGNEKLLAEKTVEYDITKPFEIQTGVGAGAGTFGGALSSVLLTTESMAGYSFDWHLDPHLPDGAMAFPGAVIVINPNIAFTRSMPAQYFLYLHETAHHILGHTSGAGSLAAMSSPWVTREREVDADVWAAQKLSTNGVAPHTILFAAQELFGSSPGDATHYPGAVRIMRIRQALGI